MKPERRLIARLTWSVADQAASSLITLSLTVLIARVASPTTFGAFALAFGAVPVATSVMRSLVSNPMAIRHGQKEGSVSAREVTGFAIAFGAFAAAILTLTSVPTSGDLRTLLVIVGISLPGILLQDAVRAALLVLARPTAAFANNVCWLVTQVAICGILITLDSANVNSLVIAWGAAGTVFGVIGTIQLGGVPAIGSTRRWLREQRELWPSLLAEQFVMSGSWQLALIALAAVSGVAATAGIRGAQTIFGPITMLHLALPFTVIPVLGRRFQTSEGVTGGIRLMIAISLALSVGALVVTGALLVVPDSAGQQILGDSWSATRALLIPFGVYIAGTGANRAALFGLRALAAVHRTVVIRSATGVSLLLGAGLGAFIDQARGFAAGLAVATWAMSILWWTVFMREVRSTWRGS